MIEKDSPLVQQQRIRDRLRELLPAASVEFQKGTFGFRFRIDSECGNVLGCSGEYDPSEIADWPDEKLRQTIRIVAHL